jgi:hypothetical protein
MSGKIGKKSTTSRNLKKLTSLNNSADDNDLHNLEFLLTCFYLKGYREWQAQVDDDDLDYALELLIEYNLMIQEALCEAALHKHEIC